MLCTETALSWQAGQGVGSITAPATVSAASNQQYKPITAGHRLVRVFSRWWVQLHELPGGLGRSEGAGVYYRLGVTPLIPLCTTRSE